MAKSKKKAAKQLIDLKSEESGEINLDSFDLEIDLNLNEVVLEAAAGSDIEKQTASLPPTPDQSLEEEERTIRLVQASATELDSKKEDHETKVSYGLPSKQNVPSGYSDKVMGSMESTLKQSEHLRIAQNKLNSMEEELEKLRRENEELASAGETFKRINEEYYSTIDNLKVKLDDSNQTNQQEISLLKKISKNKEKQITDLKQQIDELKSRIDNNFRRVRKREKDLEHRLEIAKMEEAAVIKSKDQLILDLKRRIDDISSESENFRQKSQENYKELQKKQQVVRGVVRALRIALTKLEGDDDSDTNVETVKPLGKKNA